MDITVKAKCDVPSRVKEEALLRIQHATRFFDRLTSVEMVFGAEHNPRIAEPAVVEVTGRTKGHYIRAEGWGADHRGALDVAVTRFERQLARYKARLVGKTKRRGPRSASPVPRVPVSVDTGTDNSGDSAAQGWPQPRIVRRKEFTLTPMTAEEAAVQLELLDHEFFLFADVATGHGAVVYRRKDGDLGLIQAAAPADSDQ